MKDEPPVNPHDEVPIGGGSSNPIDDLPVKANNFDELLEKELQKNAGGDMHSGPPVQPKSKPKKQFLKRKKPVTAPPKNNKPAKYKYYAENFTDDPFAAPVESAPKPVEKKSKKTPFGNVAERKAVNDQLEKPTEKKNKPKKTFLTRGGGTGGGIGSKKDSPREAKSEKPHHKRDSSQANPKSKPKRGKRKLFEDSEDNESSDNSDSHGEGAEDQDEASGSDHGRNDSQNDGYERTEIPEHLTEYLPPKAREQIESKLRDMDIEIAEFTKRHNNHLELTKDHGEMAFQTKIQEIKNEIDNLEFQSQQDIMELKDYENAELKKIRKERKDFERFKKENKSTQDNKKGKQEIDELKAKIEAVKSEIRAKDKKNHTMTVQLQDELDFYTQENESIQSEIRQLEKTRITAMRKQRESTTNRRQNHIEDTSNRPQKKTEDTYEQYEASNTRARVVSHQNEHDSPDEDDKAGNYSDASDNEEDNNSNDSDEESYQMVFPDIYHKDNSPLVDESVKKNGKIERIFSNGKRELIFNNGVKKQIFPDGYQIVFFNNKDIKQTYPDKKSVYYFSEANTTQTTFPNELKVFRFGNGQIEKHYPDQTKEVRPCIISRSDSQMEQ